MLVTNKLDIPYLYNTDGSRVDRTPETPEQWAELVAETFASGYWHAAVAGDAVAMTELSDEQRVDFLLEEFDTLGDRDDYTWLRLPDCVRALLKNRETLDKILRRCWDNSMAWPTE